MAISGAWNGRRWCVKELKKPLSANLHNPEFAFFLMHIEETISKKYSSKYSTDKEELQGSSPAMEKLLKAVKADKFIFPDDETQHIPALKKFLYAVVNNALKDAMMEKLNHNIRFSGEDLSDEIPADDVEVGSKATERIEERCLEDGITFSDLDTVYSLKLKLLRKKHPNRPTIKMCVYEFLVNNDWCEVSVIKAYVKKRRPDVLLENIDYYISIVKKETTISPKKGTLLQLGQAAYRKGMTLAEFLQAMQSHCAKPTYLRKIYKRISK